MVVQHNMQAMNANRMLGITSKSQAKATEKLSSGYKINRAADDAAGLSISEKMRQQIRGLDQASTNAQDGISAVQTAEGALTEVHSMLQRMNELAVQAANGTNSESDRQSIQDEIEQLTTEIDRVAETTKFNETYLLKGNGKETTINIDVKNAGIDGELIGVGTGLATFKMDALETGERITIGSKGYTIGTDLETVREKVPTAGNKMTINGTEYQVVENGKTDPATYSYTQDEIKSMISDTDRVVIGSDTYVAMEDGDSKATHTDIDAVKKELIDSGKNGNAAPTSSITIDNRAYTVGTDTTVASQDDIIAELDKAIADGTITETSTITVGGNAMSIEADGLKAIKTAIDGLSEDDTVVTAGGTMTVDLTADLATIAGQIKDGSEIEYSYQDADGNDVDVETVASANVENGIGDNDASIISREQAYKLIGEEILKASSVGCDPGSDALAVDVNGNALVEDADAYQLLDKDGNVISNPEDYDKAVTIRYSIQEAKVEAKQGLQFTLHVGADADESNKIALTIDAMDAAGLGIKNMNVVDNTGAKATYAIDAIAEAISKVSAQRSELGAVQNRLEHTIANLDNVVENTTSAESSIRDTDMAEAMVEYSKNNILQQAGQSMLAQANQATQGVLSLLQ